MYVQHNPPCGVGPKIKKWEFLTMLSLPQIPRTLGRGKYSIFEGEAGSDFHL